MLDHATTNLQQKGNEPSHVPATPDRVFQLVATDRGQVECQQRQQQPRFVRFETLRRQVNPDRIIELAQTVLERPTLAVVSDTVLGEKRLVERLPLTIAIATESAQSI